MATVILIHIEFDDTRPLGPQLAAAREAGVPWKMLEVCTGLSRQYMWQLMTEWPDRVVDNYESSFPSAARAH